MRQRQHKNKKSTFGPEALDAGPDPGHGGGTTVKELIALLQEHDPESRVLFDDTECGHSDIQGVKAITEYTYKGDGTPPIGQEPAVLLGHYPS